jgi:hypothetical protein
LPRLTLDGEKYDAAKPVWLSNWRPGMEDLPEGIGPLAELLEQAPVWGMRWWKEETVSIAQSGGNAV